MVWANVAFHWSPARKRKRARAFQIAQASQYPWGEIRDATYNVAHASHRAVLKPRNSTVPTHVGRRFPSVAANSRQGAVPAPTSRRTRTAAKTTSNRTSTTMTPRPAAPATSSHKKKIADETLIPAPTASHRCASGHSAHGRGAQHKHGHQGQAQEKGRRQSHRQVPHHGASRDSRTTPLPESLTILQPSP